MTTVFYVVMVIFAGLSWSWGWFILSLLFSLSAREVIKYKYTNDPNLDEEEVDA